MRRFTPSRRSLLAAVAAGAVTAAAGLAGPGAAASHATARPVVAPRPGRPKPVIFVVGDSTSSAYQHSERPRAGWGQALPLLLGPQAAVFDYAWSGASSKSFADAGLLDEVLDMLQPGDYLLISFGHNDEKVQDPARGTDPQTTFKEYLQKYIGGAAERGARPVLVTPVERRRFSALGVAQDSHGAYPQAVRELAAATGTPLVDLTVLSKDLWQQLGAEGTKSHFLYAAPGQYPQYPEGVADNTHFQAEGALAVARLVARELQAHQTVPPGYFQFLDAGLDALNGIHWPSERPVDKPLVLEVGSGSAFATVQAAVDAVPAGSTRRTQIRIAPGTYRGTIRVPANKPRISFIGLGEKPEDVVLVYNNASGTAKPDGTGTFGTGGSASVRIDGPDFMASNLTFSNDFDEAANQDMRNRQAVALFLAGDRAVLRNVRCLGNQDTLLIDSPARGVQSRFFFRDCYVEGDVDFIFGRGTAVFSGCEIRSLDRGSATNNGYVSAGSLNVQIKHGYLFTRCRFVSAAAAGSVHLGRPWHPSGDVDAIAQVLVRDSWLGAHISGAPWTDMSGFSWQEARFHEFNNNGPGSRITATRPQLDPALAGEFTLEEYLRGTDGWAPQLAGTRADSTQEMAGTAVAAGTVTR
ncbi:pectinesterase family protein [Pseudarthrobacter sp. NamE5]|uniref:pectinesterase family protein n=1 Tax=Pseudarthrobacter sp. NamE5 TaxID=2576839 RepID=UPI00110A81ED|nr:pectinesterase family protein [Pseudarthrobacter sp. NamE5]TLM84249.1 pectin esterase [Pseudarthrobacter sp. NamE5]